MDFWEYPITQINKKDEARKEIGFMIFVPGSEGYRGLANKHTYFQRLPQTKVIYISLRKPKDQKLRPLEFGQLSIQIFLNFSIQPNLTI